MIQIAYRIDAPIVEEFLRAIHTIAPARRRNGASSWRVFRDLGEDGLFVERFIIASWAEYVRLRARVTMADRNLQDRIERLQRSGGIKPQHAAFAERGLKGGELAIDQARREEVRAGARFRPRQRGRSR